MPESKPTRAEIAERGEAVYDRQIRSQVESDHRGDYLVLDINSGEYEIDSEDIIATKRLLARCPDAVIFGLRVGHRAAYRLGGFSKANPISHGRNFTTHE